MKNICKRLLALCLAALMLISMTALAEDDLLEKIRARGSLIIATEGNWKPWTYHDENDKLTGFDVEVGRLIAGKLGVEAEFRETEWSALIAGVKSGLFDIACNGFDYTPERAKSYDFSDPYVFTEIALVVRKDNEDIRSFEDLAGKVTSNSPSSTYAQRAEALGASVVYVDAFDGTMMMVEQGRAEASINALGTIQEYLETKPNANLKIVQIVPGDPVCIPIRKGAGNAGLLAAINQVIADARADGSLAELSLRFFGKDLTVAP